MKKIALAIIASSLIAVCAAQESATEPKLVSFTAKGTSVNVVLTQIFEQAGDNYVLEPNIWFALHMSLENIEFKKALKIVCDIAGLSYDVRDGIYFIKKAKKPIAPPEPKKVETQPKPAAETEKEPPKIVTGVVLRRVITTRFNKTDLREVFEEFGKQAKVKIEIDEKVPDYRIDAFLIKTSLKYALDEVTKATKLSYRFTAPDTIRITTG